MNNFFPFIVKKPLRNREAFFVSFTIRAYHEDIQFPEAYFLFWDGHFLKELKKTGPDM